MFDTEENVLFSKLSCRNQNLTTRSQNLTTPLLKLYFGYTRLVIAELLDDLVESVLHAVGEVESGLADGVDAEGQHLAHILQGRLVALARLESLSSAHESLYIIGLVLQDSSGVTDSALKVGELLVASGSVVVALQRKLTGL